MIAQDNAERRRAKTPASQRAEQAAPRAASPGSRAAGQSATQNPLDRSGVFSREPVFIKLGEKDSIALAEKLSRPAEFNDALKGALSLHGKLVKGK